MVMSVQRKKIITTEIKYWKQHNLLPEHYCDFLLTLYTEGEEVESKPSSAILSKEKKTIKMQYIWLAIIGLAVSASLFIFKDNPLIPMSIATITVISLLIGSMNSRLLKKGIVPFLYVLCAMILLCMSLVVWMSFFEGQTMLLIALLILNCVLWLFAGRMLKLIYFTISGAAGLLLIIGFLLTSL